MTSETNQKTSSVPLPGDTIVVSHCWIVNYNKTEQPVQMNQNDDQVANIHLSRCSAAINDHIFDSIGQQKLPSKKRKRNFENDEDKEFPCVKRRKLMFQKCARNDDNEDEELPYLKKKLISRKRKINSNDEVEESPNPKIRKLISRKRQRNDDDEDEEFPCRKRKKLMSRKHERNYNNEIKESPNPKRKKMK